MEERVALDEPLDPPARCTERDARERDEATATRNRLPPATPREGQRDRARNEHERKREVERRVHGEGQRERCGDERERPHERLRRPVATERPREQAARQQEHEARGREPQPEAEAVLGEQARQAQQRHREQERRDAQAHASRAATRPDASHRAPSRYVRPRSPWTSTPRRRSATSISRRACSAYASPRCLRRKRSWPRRFSTSSSPLCDAA